MKAIAERPAAKHDARAAVRAAQRVPGHPIAPAARAGLEARFGHDLGDIRVHTDDLAAAAARELDAHAFTVGRDLFFARGAYRPGTPDGDALLEHEVAHALAAPRTPAAAHGLATRNADEIGTTPSANADSALTTSAPGDIVERSADAATAALRAGRTPVVGAVKESDVRFARAAAGLVVRPADARDPGQVIESLVQSVLRTLNADANDSSGAVRGQLARFDERTRRLVLDSLHDRLVSADWRHLIDVLSQPLPEGIEQGAEPGEAAPAAAGAAEARDGAAAAEAPREPQAADAARAGEPEPGARGAAAERRTAEGQPAEGAAPGEAQGEVDHPPLQGAEAPKPEEAQGATAPAGPAPAAEQGGAEAIPGTAIGDAPLEAQSAEGVTVRSSTGAEPPQLTPAEAAATDSAGPEAAPSTAAPGAVSSPAAPEPAAAASTAGSAAQPADAPAAGTAPTEAAPPAEVAEAAVATVAEPAAEPPLPAVPETRSSSFPPPPDVPEGASPSSFTPPAAVQESVAAGTAAAPPERTASEPGAPDTASEGAAPEAAAPTSSESAATESTAATASAEPPASAEAATPAATAAAGPGPSPSAAAEAGPGVGAAPAGGEPARAPVPIPPAPAPPGNPVVDLGPERGEADDDAVGRLGGGGGGSALPDPPQREVAVPAGAPPAAALAAVASGTPADIGRSLGAVRDAVSREGQQARGALSAAPPALQRPSGAPRGVTLQDPAAPAAMPAAARAAAVAGGNAAPTVAAALPPVPAAPLPAVPAPAVTANAEGKVTAEDAQRLAQSVDALPTTDPALQQATAGEAPTVALDGEADPAQADAHRTALATTTADAAEAGAADAAAPLGEAGIVPTVPDETLHAEVPDAGAAGGGAPGGGAPDVESTDPTAIVAEAQSGDDVRAAAQGGAQEMTASSDAAVQQAADARAQTAQDTDAAITEGAEGQDAERTRTLTAVRRHRGDWTAAQKAVVDTAQTEGDQEVVTARRVTAEARTRGNDEARTHVGEGNRRIADARTAAEGKARAERERAKSESKKGGFFSRLASAVTSFFSELRDAIHKAFEAARKAVTDAIQWAQKAAAAAIDKARNAIVAGLKFAADQLTKITDVLLAAFPAARDRFRKLIRDAVTAAIAAVDRFANALKAGVQRLLNALGRALIDLLNAAEKGLNDALATVQKAVMSAIKAAQSFVTAAAAFAALIRDIARSPGQWLSNLGAAIVDGLKNHLWSALKAAVKQWFNSKVEQVVGIGRMVFDVLRKGGIQFGKIAAMVWSALKAAIPRAIVEFLVTRLVAMLVPALGAIMAIIDGLKAAWATAQRIIAAFDRFIAFLRAVKEGNAGPLFAQALAAAAVAVIEFVANFVMSKLAAGAKGVAGKLKGIADKVVAWLRRGAAAVKRGFQRVKQAVIAAAKYVVRQARRLGRYLANTRIGKAIGRGLRRLGAAVGRGLRRLANTRVGRFIVGQYQRAAAKYRELRERFRAWRERRKAARAQNNADRLDKAVAAIRPKLHAMLSRGVSDVRLRLTLAAWKVWYRLRLLAIEGTSVVAGNSPAVNVAEVFKKNRTEILTLVHRAALEVLNDRRVTEERARIAAERARVQAARATQQNDSALPVIATGTGPAYLAEALNLRESARAHGFKSPYEYGSASPLPSLGVFAEQQALRGPGGIRVGGPGRTYDAFVKGWAELRAKARATDPRASDATLDARLARRAQDFIRSGAVAPEFDHPEGRYALNEFARVIGTAETARRSSNVIYSALLLDLAQDPNNPVPVAAAFSNASAINPMAFKGASPGNRRVEQEINDPTLRPSEAKNPSEARKREINLIAEFVTREIAALDFENEAEFMEWIRANLQAKLVARARELYNLTDLPTTPSFLRN